MKNHTRNLSPNTVAFSCLEESVATIIIDVVLALASVLCWRPSAKYLLIEILARIAESDSFECGHADFSAAIWPHLAESARKEKFSKWLAKLKEDMKLSLFSAVKIAPPRHKKTEDGQHVGLPTLYQRGAFWGLFRAVQDYAVECDLLSLPVRMRRLSVRAFVAKWVEKYGAIPIERVKKTDGAKSAKPTLPCSCACASCQSCAAKAPVSSILSPSEPVIRTDLKAVDAQIEDALERLFSAGQGWVNLGLKVNDFTRKVWERCEQNEARLLEAVKRHNKNGSLKLVGGQPK